MWQIPVQKQSNARWLEPPAHRQLLRMDSIASVFNFHGSERVDNLVGYVVRQAESDVTLLGDRGPAMRDDNAG